MHKCCQGFRKNIGERYFLPELIINLTFCGTTSGAGLW